MNVTSPQTFHLENVSSTRCDVTRRPPCPYLQRNQLATDAVGNTIKRVVIILASVAYFRTTMRPLAILGSTIAILGTLMYSLAKTYFPNKEVAKQA